MKIKLAVNGAGGRMGKRVVALAMEDDTFRLITALESADSPLIGKDSGLVAGGVPNDVPITSVLEQHADVVIDFSTPDGLHTVLSTCAERRIPLVIATTGFSEKQREEIGEAAQTTPILLAPSMSTAVNLLMKLVRDAAKILKQAQGGVDVEIIERHHRFKEDAPSGTALEFGRLIAAEMGQTEHVHGRSGRPGPRPHSEIGYHALRTGDNVGEHTIVFGLMGETIDLTVRGHTRDSYALGALLAARFLIEQGAGIYSMSDVLGLAE
jgi:4-hydroxy-tetrahydrodipicolinate reductase